MELDVYPADGLQKLTYVPCMLAKDCRHILCNPMNQAVKQGFLSSTYLAVPDTNKHKNNKEQFDVSSPK